VTCVGAAAGQQRGEPLMLTPSPNVTPAAILTQLHYHGE
jgi:hypothetical protein